MSARINHAVARGELASAPPNIAPRRRLIRSLPWASFAGRVIGAGVFGYAGISKVGDPAAGVRAIRAYRLLPEMFVHPVAYGLPTFEIVLAVLLLAGLASRFAAAVAAGLLTVFVAAVASAGLRGLRIDCGCFGGGGEVAKTHYLLEIGRDSLLLLMLLVVIFVKRSRLALDALVDSQVVESTAPKGMSNARRRKLQVVREEQALRRQHVGRLAAIVVASIALVSGAVGGMVANAVPSSVKPAVVAAPVGATDAGGIVVGRADAPLKLIAYEDPQCPVCREFEEVNGATLRAAVDAGKVSVEYRMRSFLGPESVRADNALAAAADEGKFEQLREELFAHQPKERTGGFAVDELLALGRSVGLDSARYANTVRSMKYAAWVAYVDDRASRDGNVGTPELVRVGGQALTIDQTLDPRLFKQALGIT